MNIGQISKEDLMWKVITHLVFVVSGVLLALISTLSPLMRSNSRRLLVTRIRPRLRACAPISMS